MNRSILGICALSLAMMLFGCSMSTQKDGVVPASAPSASSTNPDGAPSPSVDDLGRGLVQTASFLSEGGASVTAQELRTGQVLPLYDAQLRISARDSLWQLASDAPSAFMVPVYRGDYLAATFILRSSVASLVVDDLGGGGLEYESYTRAASLLQDQLGPSVEIKVVPAGYAAVIGKAGQRSAVVFCMNRTGGRVSPQGNPGSAGAVKEFTVYSGDEGLQKATIAWPALSVDH